MSNFEYVIQDDSINKSQFARRVGRLQAKFGDKNGLQTEFFASKTETVNHNWAEDPLGASLRDRIRAEGFADILSFIDNRREAYLELAEEYGATTEDLMFEEPAPAPTPTAKPRVRMSMPGYRPKEDESYLIDEAGFFSPMQLFFNRMPEDRSGTGNEFLAIINKTQGLPFVEAREMGLDTFLEKIGKKKITRDEILDYVDENRVYLTHQLRRDLAEVSDWAVGGDADVQQAFNFMNDHVPYGNEWGIGYDTSSGDHSLNVYITYEGDRHWLGDDWYDYVDFNHFINPQIFTDEGIGKGEIGEGISVFDSLSISTLTENEQKQLREESKWYHLDEDLREKIETQHEDEYTEALNTSQQTVEAAMETIGVFAQKNSAAVSYTHLTLPTTPYV